jgi:tetratricopeptide (TPR) repeat protein
MHRRSIVAIALILAAGSLAPAQQQQQQPGGKPPALEGGPFHVSSAGGATILLDTRSGKTWFLVQSAAGEAVWLPMKRIDAADEAQAWKKQQASKQPEIDRLQQALKDAVQAERVAADQERKAKALATDRLRQLEKTNALLESIFAELSPRAAQAQPGGPPLHAQLARRLREIADKLDEESVGDPVTAARLRDLLGKTLLDLGEPNQAIELHARARATREKLLGADHPDTLTSTANLADAYRAAGKLEQALALYEQTLQRMRARLGPEHLGLLPVMNGLADCYRALGRLDLALALHEETLRLARAKLGAEHPGTLTSMAGLARLYQDVGKFAEALPLYEGTLRLRMARLGKEHPETLTSMRDLARCYRAVGRLAEALPLYEQSLQLRRARLGPDHPDSLAGMHELARTYFAAGRAKEAVALIADLVAGQRRRLGGRDARFAGLLTAVAQDLLRARLFAEAEPLLREATAIQAETEPDAWTTFSTRSLLGASLLGQEKYKDAEPLLQQGYDGLKQREKAMPPAGSARLTETLERLAELHDATGNAVEADRYRKELAERKAAEKKAK